MFPLSTEDLAREAARSADTILVWHRLGLFAGIESSKTGGNAAGVRRMWAPEALVRVREIVRLKDAGFNTERLQAHFDPNHTVKGKKQPRKKPRTRKGPSAR